jgi:hypothetical protein
MLLYISRTPTSSVFSYLLLKTYPRVHIASRNDIYNTAGVKGLCKETFHSKGKEDKRRLWVGEEVGERVLFDRNALLDNAVYPIIVTLGFVESDDNDSIEEDNSSDTQKEQLMASHYSQEATDDSGEQSMFSDTIYMLRPSIFPLVLSNVCLPSPSPNTAVQASRYSALTLPEPDG